jgi:hypothetical protein
MHFCLLFFRLHLYCLLPSFFTILFPRTYLRYFFPLLSFLFFVLSLFYAFFSSFFSSFIFLTCFTLLSLSLPSLLSFRLHSPSHALSPSPSFPPSPPSFPLHFLVFFPSPSYSHFFFPIFHFPLSLSYSFSFLSTFSYTLHPLTLSLPRFNFLHPLFLFLLLYPFPRHFLSSPCCIVEPKGGPVYKLKSEVTEAYVRAEYLAPKSAGPGPGEYDVRNRSYHLLLYFFLYFCNFCQCFFVCFVHRSLST